jgi:hypothetical protein
MSDFSVSSVGPLDSAAVKLVTLILYFGSCQI